MPHADGRRADLPVAADLDRHLTGMAAQAEVQHALVLVSLAAGALDLADKLYHPCVRVIVPPEKDVRAWTNKGATRDDILRAIAGTKKHKRKAVTDAD